MQKNYKRNLYKNLLEDLRMSLSNFNYVMTYIIHKILVLLKNHLNYLKDNIFECFLKKYNILLFQKRFFFQNT